MTARAELYSEAADETVLAYKQLCWCRERWDRGGWREPNRNVSTELTMLLQNSPQLWPRTAAVSLGVSNQDNHAYRPASTMANQSHRQKLPAFISCLQQYPFYVREKITNKLNHSVKQKISRLKAERLTVSNNNVMWGRLIKIYMRQDLNPMHLYVPKNKWSSYEFIATDIKNQLISPLPNILSQLQYH